MRSLFTHANSKLGEIMLCRTINCAPHRDTWLNLYYPSQHRSHVYLSCHQQITLFWKEVQGGPLPTLSHMLAKQPTVHRVWLGQLGPVNVPYVKNPYCAIHKLCHIMAESHSANKPYLYPARKNLRHCLRILYPILAPSSVSFMAPLT